MQNFFLASVDILLAIHGNMVLSWKLLWFLVSDVDFWGRRWKKPYYVGLETERAVEKAAVITPFSYNPRVKFLNRLRL
jgi:hypothetical protein